MNDKTRHIPRINEQHQHEYPPPVDVPTPSKRPKWPWLIALGVVLVVIIASCNASGSSDTSAATPDSTPVHTSGAAPTQKATDDPLEDDGWKASDIQVKKEQFGTSVTARIQNTDGDETRTGVFTLTVFLDGKRIYDAMGSANNVEPGKTVTVTFVGTTDDLPGDPASYTYQLQTDL